MKFVQLLVLKNSNYNDSVFELTQAALDKKKSIVCSERKFNQKNGSYTTNWT